MGGIINPNETLTRCSISRSCSGLFSMDQYCLQADSSWNAYWLLLQVLSLIPLWHYLLLAAFILFSILYNFLELYFLQDLFSGFSGSPVLLSYNTSSSILNAVVSKCKILHGRYFATPWLCSPHLQTLFLNYFGRPPPLKYTKQLFSTADGETIALDWLSTSHVSGDVASEDESVPIVVVIPGLTSDSSSQYIKHLAYHTAKRGWKVVICNHRGFGGVSITSGFSYNAGWTEDIRAVVNYLHKEKSMAPLFVVGTSIGANILVKYLGEDGENIPVAGAVAVCSPWDLLIGDRYIRRRRVQKIYDKAIAFGLQDYAKLHQSHFSRNANWEGIEKSVDTFYRRCSSSTYVQSVSVPLLCISALDDPICTTEAIPWDECKWVRAVNEFLGVLHSSNYMHVQEKVKTAEDGMVAELNNDQLTMWKKHIDKHEVVKSGNKLGFFSWFGFFWQYELHHNHLPIWRQCFVTIP
ncbi:Embryogenesis-associated protein EMB8 [Glycine max]|nr:Embryogenesis-associated protein EMB8 [Glycine max]